MEVKKIVTDEEMESLKRGSCNSTHISDDEYYASSQVVYLDFDGAETSYCNPDLGVTVDNVTVQNSGLTAEQISVISSALNEQYADRNVTFVTEKPQEGVYSTVYVGKTDDFEAYGDFLGLAETIDADNQIKDDDAFVFMDSAFSTDEIISVISHEVGHIAEGMQHDVCSGTLDDYAYQEIKWGTISSTKSDSNTIQWADENRYFFTPAFSGAYVVWCTIKEEKVIANLTSDKETTHIKYIADNTWFVTDNWTFYEDTEVQIAKDGRTLVYLEQGTSYRIWVSARSPSLPRSYEEDYYLAIYPYSNSTPTPTGKADLSLASMALSSHSITQQEAINVTFSVQNTGTSSAGGSYAYIYDGDTKLGQVWVSSIDSGETSGAYSYTIGAGKLSAGTHSIKVIVDASNAVDEFYETNNSAAHTVTVSAADLTISSLSASSYTVSSTNQFTLSFTVKNAGNLFTGANFAYVYYGSKVIGQVYVRGLTAGETTDCACTIDAGILSEGVNKLKVVVDGNQVISESNENNNSASCSVTVKNPKTDLSISSLSASSSTVFSTDQFVLSFTVKNTGDVFTGANFAYVYNGSDVIGQLYVRGLTAGETTDCACTIDAWMLSEGTNDLKVVVDGNQVISESNENNNSASCSVTVKNPKTDLIISSIGASASTVYSTEQITLNFTIKNVGEVFTGANFAYVYNGSDVIGQVYVRGLTAGETTDCVCTIDAGILSEGANKLKVVVDGNGVIPETNESNNSTYWSVRVKQQSDLKPGVMTGWEDSIEICGLSNPGKTGVQTSSKKCTVANDICLSWAITNAGEDISQNFKTTLFLDGVEYNTLTTDSLQRDQYAYVQNINLGKLSAGLHTVRIYADSTGVVSESNEYNNDFSKTFVVAAQSTPATVTDYNGSGKSDVLHVASDGKVYVLSSTSNGYEWSGAVNSISGWKLAESRRDVTGDGLADIQIICDSGNMTYVAALRNDYKTYGEMALNYYLIGGYDNTQWSYIGSADVNGDGKSEFMMMQTAAGSDHGTRHVAAWVTNDAGQWVDNIWVGGAGSNWNVTGTADVDGNGSDNVILCRADGMIGYWSETGTNQIVEVWNAGGSTMLTCGDFTGSNTDGILWTNAYGDFFTWNNIATGLVGERIGNVSDLTGSWAFGSVGDYDGDGKDDILWCNTATGALAYGGATKNTFANLVQIA